MAYRTARVIACALIVLIASYSAAHACTSVLVSRGASKTGGPIISYSCDGTGYLARLRLLPAADYPTGTMMEVRNWSGITGSIPQVAHTCKVVGWMNEFQLAIGETTFDGRTELENRQGLMTYPMLMQLALQRAKTAREAIRVITSLAETHGYGSTGESISIADKEEAWILEIIGTGAEKPGCVWVAVRVPDGMISAHANMARIREFPLDDPDNCLHAKEVISFAERKGYFDPAAGKAFSFMDAYNPPTAEQVRYSARRVWSIFRRVAPSQNFSPDYSSSVPGAEPYPLCIKPDAPLDVRDVIALHRDHYEGTPFDMTKDLAAGPFGAPDRWRPMRWDVDGQTYGWERAIATQTAAYVFVSEARASVPDAIGGIFWLGLDNPATNFFVPLYTSITAMPESYVTGNVRQFSRDSAWWAFNFVATYAQMRWQYMIEDIRARQSAIEDLSFGTQPAIEAAALHLLETRPELVAPFLTKYCLDNAEMNIRQWWQLADHLVTKYNDGYIMPDEGRPNEVGYPEEWLRREITQRPEQLKMREKREKDNEL